MVSKLTDTQIQNALKDLPKWEHTSNDTIKRQFKFKNFSQAWGFMSRVALIAETLNHHPDWSNTYNTVNIALTTHDAGGLSEKDMDMARQIDSIFEEN